MAFRDGRLSPMVALFSAHTFEERFPNLVVPKIVMDPRAPTIGEQARRMEARGAASKER